MPDPGVRPVCRTRFVKDARARAAGRLGGPSARGSALAPLFSGSVHFLRVDFGTPGGIVGVSASDTQTAVRYCAAIAPIASRYAAQYGPNSIAVDPSVAAQRVSPSAGTTYSDKELAGWVDEYAARASLPSQDAVAVLNPPSGVENADAPVSQGVLGYHSVSPGGHPYLFVNVLGSGFEVNDPAGYFALALSHELQEMLVDPQANGAHPEVCDPCAGNCSSMSSLELFDANLVYLGATTTPSTAPPVGTKYSYFLNSMVLPANARDCPAPAAACAYPPP